MRAVRLTSKITNHDCWHTRYRGYVYCHNQICPSGELVNARFDDSTDVIPHIHTNWRDVICRLIDNRKSARAESGTISANKEETAA